MSDSFSNDKETPIQRTRRLLQEQAIERLTKPARVGGTIFGVGLETRLVIERAQREYEYHEADKGAAPWERNKIQEFVEAVKSKDQSAGDTGERGEVIRDLHRLMEAWGNNQLYLDARAVVFRAWRFLKRLDQSAIDTGTTPRSANGRKAYCPVSEDGCTETPVCPWPCKKLKP